MTQHLLNTQRVVVPRKEIAGVVVKGKRQ